MSEEREAFSYAELAVRYGVSTRTLRNWRRTGKLKPAFQNGQRVTRLIPCVEPEKASDEHNAA